jgi:2-polyprenyl-3-methyl-5-hydroxy-6-metoxy-1,4-benzoquinol methylase
MYLELYNESYNLFCDSIKLNKARILDVGCGPGNITKYIKSKRNDFEILGIDNAPNMVKLAKKNNPTENFKILDCKNIDKIKKKFDGIISGFCIPYLSPNECEKLISDCHTLLKNEGYLYISFVGGKATQSGIITGSSGDKMFFYYYKEMELLKQFSKYNFELVRNIKVNYQKTEGKIEIHTILILRKKL